MSRDRREGRSPQHTHESRATAGAEVSGGRPASPKGLPRVSSSGKTSALGCADLPIRSQLAPAILAYLRATGRDVAPLLEAFDLPSSPEFAEVVLPLSALQAFFEHAERDGHAGSGGIDSRFTGGRVRRRSRRPPRRHTLDARPASHGFLSP